MTRTTILSADNSAGELHVDYDREHEYSVFLHASSGSFSSCLLLDEKQARAMAGALLKAAYAIEAAQPQTAPTT